MQSSWRDELRRTSVLGTLAVLLKLQLEEERLNRRTRINIRWGAKEVKCKSLPKGSIAGRFSSVPNTKIKVIPSSLQGSGYL